MLRWPRCHQDGRFSPRAVPAAPTDRSPQIPPHFEVGPPVKCGDGVVLVASGSMDGHHDLQPENSGKYWGGKCWGGQCQHLTARAGQSQPDPGTARAKGGLSAQTPQLPSKLPSLEAAGAVPHFPQAQAEKQLCKSRDSFQSHLHCSLSFRDAKSCSDAEGGAGASLPPTVSPTPLWLKSRTLSLLGCSPCCLDATLGSGQASGDHEGMGRGSPNPAQHQHRDSCSLPCRAKNRLQLRSWC